MSLFVIRVKNKMIAIGTLNVEGMTELKNTLRVGGRKVNLISIIQLCDYDLLVHFDKRRYYCSKRMMNAS